MLSGFKKLILRGKVVDLAVAVVIGVAFGAVVSSFVADVFTPLIAAIVGKPDLSALVVAIVRGPQPSRTMVRDASAV